MVKLDRLKAKNIPTATGGPLGNNKYIFEQLHFHWGSNDDEGSETTVNNQSYPLEMHAVFYNSKYNSFNEAGNHEDGLAVIGYFFEVRQIVDLLALREECEINRCNYLRNCRY